MEERWLPVRGYEGHYEVSDLGAVRSLERLVPDHGGRNGGYRVRRFRGRTLAPFQKRDGHVTVKLSLDGVVHALFVHRLVAIAFVAGERDGLEVCHNDGVPNHNHATNLRWDTDSSNMFDRVKHGVHHQANKTHCPQGHPYDATNTRVIPSRPNARYCRACAAARRLDDKATSIHFNERKAA